MKLLLAAINAKYIHSNPAVHSLKACAGEWESAVEIAEYTINQPVGQIRADIYRRHPDMIGFSCYIWNIGIVEALVRDLAAVLPQTDIWMGGPEVSYDVSERLRSLPIRGVMAGAGEKSFRRLAKAYAEGRQDELPACLAEEPVPLSQIPFWYRDLTEFENRIIYYESSRGCPFSCSYCLSSIDRSLSFRDPEQVKEELTFFLEKKVPQVKFIDRTFNCKKSHALAIWRFLAEHDNGITNFHFEIAADLIDEEMLTVLEGLRPGQVQLEIGVQSTCPKTVEAIHRKMDFARVAEVVTRIRSRHNIHVHLDLIAGLPWEDYVRFGQSFDDVYALHPEQLQLGFLKVLKGSAMAEAAASWGIVYTAAAPYEVMATSWISYDEILRLKQIEEVLELYYNSGQFTHTIREMEKHFPSAFAMYEQLADWYETHDYFGIQSSRVVRYDRLLGFLQEKDPEREAQYRELLTYDLYLREHMKNRPAFAPVQTEAVKERISGWMAEAAEGRHTPEGYEGMTYRELVKQLHGEVFTDADGGERLLIFDYRRRDSLTMDARVIEWR